MMEEMAVEMEETRDNLIYGCIIRKSIYYQ
jgi:hypothetical protein